MVEAYVSADARTGMFILHVKDCFAAYFNPETGMTNVEFDVKDLKDYSRQISKNQDVITRGLEFDLMQEIPDDIIIESRLKKIVDCCNNGKVKDAKSVVYEIVRDTISYLHDINEEYEIEEEDDEEEFEDEEDKPFIQGDDEEFEN